MPTPGCWGPYKSPPELRPGLSEQPPWARPGRAEPVSLLPGSVIRAGSGSLAQGPCADLSLRTLLALVAPPPRRGTRDTRGRRQERGGSRQGAPLYRRWAAVPVCPLPPRSRCALLFSAMSPCVPLCPQVPPGSSTLSVSPCPTVPPVAPAPLRGPAPRTHRLWDGCPTSVTGSSPGWSQAQLVQLQSMVGPGGLW